MRGIGERLRELRVGADVTQKDIADVLGLSATAVSRMESGSRAINAHEVGVIAEAFGWDARDLLGIARPQAKLEVAARLREADGSVTTAAARASQLVEIDAVLDDVGMADPSSGLRETELMRAPTSRAAAIAQGHEAAAALRARLGIEGPIVDLIDFAERRLGIDVVICALEENCDGIIALSDTVAVTVIDANVRTSGRQRFTLAHEIGHGLMGDVTDVVRIDVEGDDLVEERAHAFASALLMPEAELRAVLGDEPDAVRCVDAMATFGVSWTALRRRCERMGITIPAALDVMSGEDVFAAAGRAADAHHLSTPMAERVPARIVRRVREGYARRRVGAEVFGLALGLDGDELEAALAAIPAQATLPAPATSLV